jgi:hypothetical protein
MTAVRSDRVSVAGFLMLTIIGLPGWALSSQGEPAVSPPLVKSTDVDKVTLFRIYRIAKWDTGSPGAATYDPGGGRDLIVIRFYRESVNPGQELPTLKVVVRDLNGQPLDQVENLRRARFAATEKWAELVFQSPKGRPLSVVIFNAIEFDVGGLAISEEPGPLPVPPVN